MGKERKSAVVRTFEEDKDFALAYMGDVAERLCENNVEIVKFGRGVLDIPEELGRYINWAIESGHFDSPDKALDDPKIQEVINTVRSRICEQLGKEFDLQIQACAYKIRLSELRKQKIIKEGG